MLHKVLMKHRGAELAKIVVNLSFPILLLLLFCIYSVKEHEDLFAREPSGANFLMKKENS